MAQIFNCWFFVKVRRDSTVVGDSASTAIWSLVSRGSGFGRVVLVGAILGPSFVGNVFQLANQLPWIVFEVAIGALLSALLIPALISHITAGDTEATERMAGGLLGIVLVAFSLLAGLVAILAEPIAQLFALPVTDASTKEQFVSAAVPLVLLTAPQLIGYGVAITAQSVQQAMGYFALPAAASIVENVIVIGTLIAFFFIYGTGVTLSDISGEQLLLLGGGSSVGVAAHALLQLWGVRRTGLRFRPRAGWRDPEVRQILVRAVPASGTALLNGVRLFVLLVASNTVAGGVVAIQLAINVVNFPVALASKPVAFALLPRLSAFYQDDRRVQFSDAYTRGVSLSSLMLIPAASATIALGWFAASGVAIGEMGSSEGRLLLAYALVGITGAILGEGLHQLATAAAYSQNDTATPLRSLVLRLGLTVLGIAVSLTTLEGASVVLGIAVSMSVADLLSATYLHWSVTSRLEAISYKLSSSLNATAITSITAFGLAGAVAFVLREADITQAQGARLAFTGVAVGLAMVAFVAMRSRFDDELHALVKDLRPSGGAQ